MERNRCSHALYIEVAVWHKALCIHELIRVEAEHVLIEEHLEAITCIQVQVPVVAIEECTPAEAHFHIDVASYAVNFLLADVPNRDRAIIVKCVSCSYFCVPCEENINFGSAVESEAFADIPVHIQAHFWTNGPRIGVLAVVVICSCTVVVCASSDNIIGGVELLADPLSSRTSKRVELQLGANLVPAAHYGIQDIHVAAPFGRNGVKSSAWEAANQTRETKCWVDRTKGSCCVAWAVRVGLNRAAEPGIAKVGIPIIVVELDSKANFEAGLVLESCVDDVRIAHCRADQQSIGFGVCEADFHVVLDRLPVGEASVSPNIPRAACVDHSRLVVCWVQHYRAYWGANLFAFDRFAALWLWFWRWAAAVVLPKAGSSDQKGSHHPRR